jgi:hypothetical protein
LMRCNYDLYQELFLVFALELNSLLLEKVSSIRT